MAAVGGPPLTTYGKTSAKVTETKHGHHGLDFTKAPLSCVAQIIEKYMDCDTKLTTTQEIAAYNAWTSTTGYTPLDMNKVFSTMQTQADDLFNLNSFYFFIPVLLLILIILGILIFASKLRWEVGLLFALLAIYLLYGFSIAYRIVAQNSYHDQYAQLQNQASSNAKAYQQSVAYYPQGLLAVSCAITCNGACDPTTCWTCNDKSKCKPKPNPCKCTKGRSCHKCNAGSSASSA